MDDILNLLTQYDNNNSKAEALTTFKTPFLQELGGSGNIEESQTLQNLPGKTTNTEGKSMYSLSRLREFNFGPRSVNVALFKHPYTPEEIVEIMFKLNTYSEHIIDIAKKYAPPPKYDPPPKNDPPPKQNIFMKFFNKNEKLPPKNEKLPPENEKSLPEYFDNLKRSLSQKREETAFKQTLSDSLKTQPELVGLFDKAIRNFHFSESSKSYFENSETEKVLGDYMS